jgi:hypothetical protein
MWEEKIVKELLWEQEEPRWVEKKIVREILKQEVQPRFWIKKQLLRELLYTEGHIEKNIIKMIFEQEPFITSVFPVEKKWLVRELLEKIPSEYVEKKLVREVLFNKSVEKKIAQEILKEELLIGEPRFVEKKLIREILKQKVQPRFWLKKQLIRELLYLEEPRHIEKSIIKMIVEHESVLGHVFPVEKKWLVRELLEKIPTEYVEKKLVREILFENKLVEKQLIRKQLFEQEPVELMTRQFEKVMYPTMEQRTVMPVVYNYPIDLTLPLVETELFCHKVEGRHIFPTSGYLHMVWKSLAKLQGVYEIEKLPVVFENVEFHRPTIMMVRGTPVKKIVEFKVKIVPTTGLFEIVESEKVVVSGRVKVATKRVYETVLPQREQFYLPVEETLRREEIYEQLKQLKNIEVEEELKTLLKTDIKCQYGEMLWTGKWIPFLEGLVQMKQFAKRRTTGFMLPRRIGQLTIDPIMHQQYVEKKLLNKLCFEQQIFNKHHVLPLVYDRRVKKTVVGGVELVELKGMFVPRIEKIEREILFQQQPLFQTVYNKVVVPETLFGSEEMIGEELPVEMLLHKIKREYTQYYVEECKRFAEYIVKKTVEKELLTTLVRPTTIVPTPLPVVLKHLIKKIQCERKYAHLLREEPIIGHIVLGGEFLQLLKTIVEEIHLIKEETTVLRRVQCLLVERLYKTLEKDVVINMVLAKPYFVKVFKTILEQQPIERIYQQLPWTTLYEREPRFLRNTTILPEVPVVPRFFDLEQRMKMFEEPRFRVFRTPSERVFNKYL